MRRTSTIVLAATVLGVGACADSDGGSSQATTSTTTPGTSESAAQTTSTAPGLGALTVSGTAELDGVPLEADFLGAIVRDGDLYTPCQSEIPAVPAGQFDIGLYSADQATGCGQPGAEVILWTYLGEQQVFAEAPVAWPATPTEVTDVDVTFSTGHPLGAATELRDYFGAVRDSSSRELPDGTVVEAYIGDALCGHASTRTSSDFSGYILNVVGPEVVPGCAAGAPVDFRVDGRPAIPSHDTTSESRDGVDLTVQ